MTERREPAARRSVPAERPDADGGRARFDITPDQVWQPGPPAPPPSPAEERRGFWAPLMRVALITAALLYGSIALGFAAWTWLR